MGIVEGFPAIGSADGWLVLDEVQPAGKKPMSGKVFLHGSRHWDHFCDE
jgi:methionyl-tRNA formyltransferase